MTWNSQWQSGKHLSVCKWYRSSLSPPAFIIFIYLFWVMAPSPKACGERDLLPTEYGCPAVIEQPKVTFTLTLTWIIWTQVSWVSFHVSNPKSCEYLDLLDCDIRLYFLNSINYQLNFIHISHILICTKMVCIFPNKPYPKLSNEAHTRVYWTSTWITSDGNLVRFPGLQDAAASLKMLR